MFAILLLLSARPAHPRQPPDLFLKNCAGCHGESARGTAKAPGLQMNARVAEQSPNELSTFLERGNIAAGMPSFADLPAADRRALAYYLLDLNVGLVIRPVAVTEPTRKVTWGSPRPGDWLSYNGNDSANRFSPLKQINTSNVSKLKLKWIFPMQALAWKPHPWPPMEFCM
jgi:hypothetical protein